MKRFFCPTEKLLTETFSIDDLSEIHHLKNVLRLKIGDTVEVFDGKGISALCRIVSLTTKTVSFKRMGFQRTSARHTSVILACAIPKKAKFEMIVEKCTELGVDEIIPMVTSRTEVKIKGEKALKKKKRFETVALNATKQCKRKTVPIIREITPFQMVLESLTQHDSAFIPCLYEKKRKALNCLRNVNQKQKRVILLIGPEGDFTPKEIEAASRSGCLPVTLGQTVLKVDTAAISTIGLIRSFFPYEE